MEKDNPLLATLQGSHRNALQMQAAQGTASVPAPWFPPQSLDWRSSPTICWAKSAGFLSDHLSRDYETIKSIVSFGLPG